MPLGQISTEQAAKLTKQYLATERRIKDRLALAISKGNDTTYINATLRAVEKEIKQLNLIYKGYAQLNLSDIIDQQAKSVDSQVNTFDKKFNIDSSFGQVNKEAMNVVAQNTYSSLNNVTLAMGRQTKGFLRQLGLKAASGMIDGSTTWQQTARQMTKDLKKAEFFNVNYKLKNGEFRKVPAAVYSKMVARTTAAEAFRISTHERIKSWGYDLVDVVGVSHWPESPCIPFQGKTLSITGETKGYISLEAARAAGFFHPNCIHTTVFSDKNVELVPDAAKKPAAKVTNIATKQKTKSKATSRPVSELKPRKAETIPQKAEKPIKNVAVIKPLPQKPQTIEKQIQEFSDLYFKRNEMPKIPIRYTDRQLKGRAYYQTSKRRGTVKNIPQFIMVGEWSAIKKYKDEWAYVIAHELAHHQTNVTSNSLGHTKEHAKIAAKIEQSMRLLL